MLLPNLNVDCLLQNPNFGSWCFTHQYKNTTQFYFYAAMFLSQNTKASKTGHTHDDRYYTEVEINSKLSALNANRQLVAVSTVRVNNDTTLGPTAYKDFTISFAEHSGLTPIPVLSGTGWWCGGLEVQRVTKNSLTIRFLNPLSGHSIEGGYADYVLFFLK